MESRSHNIYYSYTSIIKHIFIHFQIDEDEQKHLRSEGEDELLQLAKRLQNRFPNVLPKEFSKQSYRVG